MKKLDQEFDRTVKYMKNAQQWLTQHWNDPRDGPDRTIEMDSNTREAYAYAEKLVKLIDSYRLQAKLPLLSVKP